MRTLRERREVNKWLARGASDYAIAGITGIPRGTVQHWRRYPLRGPRKAARRRPWRPPDPAVWAYLLALYLGDGCLSPKGSQLMIALDAGYPGIVSAAEAAIETTLPGIRTHRYLPKANVVRVITSSPLWREVFPQHGRGRKHLRPIVLAGWQREITHAHPRELLRGLIHSDGCRCMNRFKTKLPSRRVAAYEYPRYFFSNLSDDIRRIFCKHCELLGIKWTQSTHGTSPFRIASRSRSWTSSSGRSGEPYSPRVSVSSIDVAVVGGGITGLAAGYALRRRGVDCRVFEAGTPGAGQSAGRTRVFRHGHDDPRLIELAVRARDDWERLEGELGVRMLGRQGVLVCGPHVRDRAAAFEAAGVAARMVTREEQARALPALSPPGDEALLDELGGFIDVRAAVDTLAAALRDELVTASVFGIAEDGGGTVELHTSEGLWRAERAIVCAGAQAGALAAELDLDVPLAIELHTRAAFTVREPGTPPTCLLDRSGVHGEVVYGSPMPDGLHYAVGLGGEEEPPVDEALRRLTAYVGRGMPGLDPEPASARLCETSILPWGGDAFAVWRIGSVDLLAGANLFKFAPLLGELLADRSDELVPDRELGRAAATAPAAPGAAQTRT